MAVSSVSHDGTINHENKEKNKLNKLNFMKNDHLLLAVQICHTEKLKR